MHHNICNLYIILLRVHEKKNINMEENVWKNIWQELKCLVPSTVWELNR